MENLEEQAQKYADRVVDSANNVTVELLKEYASSDFIAGAEWYKIQSKEAEMIELLKKLQLVFEEMWLGPLAEEIEQLIKTSTKL